jgi:chemotaxis protein methyltransferase CheR
MDVVGEKNVEQAVVSESFIDSVSFRRLKKVMTEGTGINFDYYRESYLKRRLKVRLTATKTNSYSSYTQYLLANPDEFSALIKDLTINYTKFFRDTDVYTFLEKTILPELLSSSKRWVRIWSAGCATGEEPYSLAMLVHEVFKRQGTDCRVNIYASDLDKSALAKAESGEYDKRMVQCIDEKLVSKYFEPDGDIYRVKPSVKNLIQFEEADLMTIPKHRHLDLILCRNVMIYFSKEIQQKIHLNFHDSLKAEGYLITGKTEFLVGEAADKFVDINPQCRVYKKA